MSTSLLLSNPEIQDEYCRWKRLVGDDDPYCSAKTVGLSEVLDAHFLVADFFYDVGHGLGGVGPKDLGLLHSALYRQVSGFASQQKWKSDIDKCASLLYGLVMNHPFHDANKRTALLIVLHLLGKLGRRPKISADDLENFLVEVAGHKIESKNRYKELETKYGKEDAAIHYISWFLTRNTRSSDESFHAITYKDLDRILRSFGFQLIDPVGNAITIVKPITERTMYFTIKQKVKNIGTIGFPSWTKEVPKGEIKKIREMTNLTAKNGFDSTVFFRGHEPLRTLIAQYQDQLISLADR